MFIDHVHVHLCSIFRVEEFGREMCFMLWAPNSVVMVVKHAHCVLGMVFISTSFQRVSKVKYIYLFMYSNIHVILCS